MSTTTNITEQKSTSRFYQLEMRNRPVLRGDIGSLIRIEGLVVGGGGAIAMLLLPSAADEIEDKYVAGDMLGGIAIERLSDEEWSDWLQRSDSPEVLVGGSLEKVFHRKVRYDISGAVQQKVWVADGCKCMYCGRKMGEVQLTIDHWMPLELGGVNDTSNFLASCRKCNKDKGSEPPRDWCARHGLDYDALIQYLANRRV